GVTATVKTSGLPNNACSFPDKPRGRTYRVTRRAPQIPNTAPDAPAPISRDMSIEAREPAVPALTYIRAKGPHPQSRSRSGPKRHNAYKLRLFRMRNRLNYFESDTI